MASQAAQWRRIRSFIKGRSSSNLRRTASWVASRSMQLHLAITMPTVQVIVAQFLRIGGGITSRSGAGGRGRGRDPGLTDGPTKTGDGSNPHSLRHVELYPAPISDTPEPSLRGWQHLPRPRVTVTLGHPR